MSDMSTFSQKDLKQGISESDQKERSEDGAGKERSDEEPRTTAAECAPTHLHPPEAYSSFPMSTSKKSVWQQRAEALANAARSVFRYEDEASPLCVQDITPQGNDHRIPSNIPPAAAPVEPWREGTGADLQDDENKTATDVAPRARKRVSFAEDIAVFSQPQSVSTLPPLRVSQIAVFSTERKHPRPVPPSASVLLSPQSRPFTAPCASPAPPIVESPPVSFVPSDEIDSGVRAFENLLSGLQIAPASPTKRVESLHSWLTRSSSLHNLNLSPKPERRPRAGSLSILSSEQTRSAVDDEERARSDAGGAEDDWNIPCTLPPLGSRPVLTFSPSEFAQDESIDKTKGPVVYEAEEGAYRTIKDAIGAELTAKQATGCQQTRQGEEAEGQAQKVEERAVAADPAEAARLVEEEAQSVENKRLERERSENRFVLVDELPGVHVVSGGDLLQTDSQTLESDIGLTGEHARLLLARIALLEKIILEQQQQQGRAESEARIIKKCDASPHKARAFSASNVPYTASLSMLQEDPIYLYASIDSIEGGKKVAARGSWLTSALLRVNGKKAEKSVTKL